MTRENNNEQMEFPDTWEEFEEYYGFYDTEEVYTNNSRLIPSFRVKQWLEHQMTAEDYRQRMMQAFHNADCGELIAVCVLPTEKEFEHLEWLLKNHYKKDPCEDCISRQAVLDINERHHGQMPNHVNHEIWKEIKALPPISPQPKMGRWEKRDVRGQRVDCCSVCGLSNGTIYEYNYCPNCGAKMQEVEG